MHTRHWSAYEQFPVSSNSSSSQHTPDTGQQEDSSGTDKNKPQYPPIHQAVRDQPSPENIGQLLFEEEPPSGRKERNPAYPSIHRAVSDQCTPDTDQHINNSQYPPIHPAVRDQPASRDTGQFLFREEPPLGREEKNPSYPSIHQVVSGQHTPDTG